nr:MAG TPA: Copper binding octapeptide repeat protein [Caudoviricetes sp.]
MTSEHLLVFELSQNTIDGRHVKVGVLNDVTHGSEEAMAIFGDVGGRFDDCERLEDESHARRVLAAEVVVGDDAVDGGGLLVGEVHVGHGGQWGQVVGFHAGTVSHWTLDV